MAAIRLTQRRVESLRPRKTVRTVRDAQLKGYGVRVMPSGAKRYFIHSQHQGHRVWKIVGDAAVMTEAEARGRARSLLAALRDDRDIETESSGDTLFETVAEEVFSRRRWKPRTLGVNRIYLKRQILPVFAGRPIAEITREAAADGGLAGADLAGEQADAAQVDEMAGPRGGRRSRTARRSRPGSRRAGG